MSNFNDIYPHSHYVQFRFENLVTCSTYSEFKLVKFAIMADSNSLSGFTYSL